MNGREARESGLRLKALISARGIERSCGREVNPMLVTTRALATRAMRADLVYTMQRMQVIANREGNPFGVAFKVFGAATALAAARLPSPRFNRVIGLNPAETASLHDILA
jgi:hypothetical protein